MTTIVKKCAWGVLGILAAALPGPTASVSAQHDASGRGGHGAHATRSEPGACAEPVLRCATFASPALDRHGALWVVFAAGGRIFVTKAAEIGGTFDPPVAVTPTAVALDSGADARPQILIDPHDRVVVSFAVMRGARYVGEVLVSSSADGGRTFSTPVPISANPASQRFVNLMLAGQDRILATWIDKRRLADPGRPDTPAPFDGASLAVAWSTDGGASFGPARLVHDGSCECCRLAVAVSPAGLPVVLFRNIFDGERDHAVMTIGVPGAPVDVRRVSEDRWRIDACPHHGPSLAVSADGTYHAVWFSGGGERRGLFYARSQDAGKTFTAPMPIGAAGRQPSRPFVLTTARHTWLAWKEFDGERSTVLVMSSADGGRTWSSPQLLATTDDFSDHPLLFAAGERVFLSWLTRADGYRLVQVAPSS